MNRIRNHRAVGTVRPGLQLWVLAAAMVLPAAALASSHREAPLISADPLADNADLYLFRSPDVADTVTIIATYHPMQQPHWGAHHAAFSEDIRYELHVDRNVGIAGDEIVYRFTFSAVNEDPTTFFNIRAGMRNRRLSYVLEKSVDGGTSYTTIITNGTVPPNDLGPRSINGSFGLNTTYEALFNASILTASNGEKVYCGPAEDPYFTDTGGFYDLGDTPRLPPRDGQANLNVSVIAIQAPVAALQKNGVGTASAVNILDANFAIGVWASASRQQVRTLNADGTQSYSGNFVQLSRLGMPLTNATTIPIASKDSWNALSPYSEISDTALDAFFYNPELGLYMDNSLFGGSFPAWAPLRIQRNSLGQFDFGNSHGGLYPLKGTSALTGTALDDAIFGTLLLPGTGKPRSVDLWPLTYTGVPNLRPYQLATGKAAGNPLASGKPFINNFLPNGGDMLRLNMAIPPTPRDSVDFSSLGLVRAAVLGLTDSRFNTSTTLQSIPNMDGFPNGRRLEDDVVRIQQQIVSGIFVAALGYWYDDFVPAGNPITPRFLGVAGFSTGIEKNTPAIFRPAFPYVHPPMRATVRPGDIFADGFE